MNVGGTFSENVQRKHFGEKNIHVKSPKCVARLNVHFFLEIKMRT